MRRIASILLLSLLLFNWCGYRLYTSYIERRVNEQFTAQLDNNQYDESELISIKMPSHLPYYTNNKQFDRVDGQVEIRGVSYNYVKRRVYNDSLEFLCIPNHRVTSLMSAKNEFFKLVNDLQHNGQGKKEGHQSNIKAPGFDFYTVIDPFQIHSGDIDLNHPCFSRDSQASLSDEYINPSEQPPDILS